jgi:hypothetical protein
MMRFLNRRCGRRRARFAFFADANFADKRQALAPEMRTQSDVYVLNDGIAMDIAVSSLRRAVLWTFGTLAVWWQIE